MCGMAVLAACAHHTPTLPSLLLLLFTLLLVRPCFLHKYPPSSIRVTQCSIPFCPGKRAAPVCRRPPGKGKIVSRPNQNNSVPYNLVLDEYIGHQHSRLFKFYVRQ
eukprot:Protomagalhaensia_wolfi_Nauph_80__964@NODE_1558_length_1469_cov_52_569930_g1210_i0_p1_GENE_NODE_1558_length_1469_cov_52_569930_g1210_i0NODE_1558_length_1469_cov_52_569930_g1210_i0_p1_ORF_typecomplete_len106_score5_48D123/PF07065_14/0_084_NODE_1558_length_1469_cov_52_569930_g1210_i0521838